MTELPQRPSLVAQVAEILRKEVRTGQWSKRMPSERYLSDHLQISRSTLRVALDLLRREGWIEVHHKRHWVGKAGPTRKARAESRVIAWLTSEDMADIPQYKLFQRDELRRHLHSAGYALDVHGDPRLRHRDPGKTLENLTRVRQAACWVLNMTSSAVQRWFFDSGTPAIVAGSLHEGIRLPALDFDYRAVGRHAAGQFLAMGHRRVALLIPRSNLVGDRVTEEGFREGFHGEVVMAGHDGTVKGICSALDMVVRSSHPPTGLFVSHPQHLVTVISHLSHRHLRVPEEVSVVSRHHDSFLDSLTPAIACYEFGLSRYAARLAQMAVELAHSGTLPSRQFLVMGKFRKGGSLMPCAGRSDKP